MEKSPYEKGYEDAYYRSIYYPLDSYTSEELADYDEGWNHGDIDWAQDDQEYRD